jgi:integrative and conjugative element protein (TIGR02256 family)
MKEKTKAIAFSSSNHRFRVEIEWVQVQHLFNVCATSYPYETGGILVGFYNESLDCAIITKAFLEPIDSQKNKIRFVRGIHGLQKKLNDLWVKRQAYYIGEWHFHPGGQSVPSKTDRKQMFEFASSKKINCPEPILFIISGKNNSDDFHYNSYVFANKKMISLTRENERR